MWKKEAVEPIRVSLIWISLFYGSLWGIAEAVLGYLLNLLPPGISGFVMFPVGCFFMNRAYRKSGRAGAIFYAGAVASAIKLADLLIPGIVVLRVATPAVCILFEAMLMAAVYGLFAARAKGALYAGILAAGVGWRALYVLFTFCLTFFAIPSGLLGSGAANVLRFIFLEGTANALLIVAFLWVAVKARGLLRDPGAEKANRAARSFRATPLVSAAAFAAAVSATLVLAIR
jgi:hypothetical protein